jgi:membrane-associated phospholipid phosphatase
MKKIESSLLLPHEILFGAFLVITWTRLVAVAGITDRDALLELLLILVGTTLIFWCRRRETPLRWRLRLLFYPVAMNTVFFQMKGAIPKISPERLDPLLQHLDAVLFGEQLCLRLQAFVHPVLTEFLSLCYVLFFPYLLFSMIYYFCGNLDLLKKFCSGLFSIYGIGFLGYSFVPAAGPYVAMGDQFDIALNGGWITRLNDAVVRAGSNGVDVFPSLHCAISAFFLLFDRLHRPWRFKLYLVPCIGLWISTIYLRYHYAIDVVCGFALAALAVPLAKQPLQQHELHPHIPGTVRDANRA